MYTHTNGKKYGTGAKVHNKVLHKVRSSLRPKIGKSSIPFDWTKGIQRNYTQPIKNQYMASSCGGQMMATAFQIYRTVILGLPFEELSANSFYSQGFANGGGMTLSAVSDGSLFKGITSEALVPSVVNGTMTEEQAESLSWENPTTIADSLRRIGLKMIIVPTDKESIAQAIRDYGFACWIIQGQNNGTWLSANPQPPKDNTNLWAHYMCSETSIPAGLNKIPKFQSWGDEVGDHGIQYFDETYINSGYIYEVFTFTKFTFDRNLSFGSFGNHVKYLQAKLGMSQNTLGFGFYGPKTEAYVMDFQKKHGIQQTGTVGPITRQALNTL